MKIRFIGATDDNYLPNIKLALYFYRCNDDRSVISPVFPVFRSIINYSLKDGAD